MQLKLDFELVPDGCWYSNLRSILTADQWAFIRNDALSRANGCCMVCGKKTKRLDAHERWSYNEKTQTQKLEDVVAVCKDCHSVIHIGLTSLKGDMERAENHYLKVNGVSYAEFRKKLGEANERHKELNKITEWKLDLTWLKRFIND